MSALASGFRTVKRITPAIQDTSPKSITGWPAAEAAEVGIPSCS